MTQILDSCSHFPPNCACFLSQPRKTTPPSSPGWRAVGIAHFPGYLLQEGHRELTSCRKCPFPGIPPAGISHFQDTYCRNYPFLGYFLPRILTAGISHSLTLQEGLQELPISRLTTAGIVHFQGHLLQEFPIFKDTHCRNCPFSDTYCRKGTRNCPFPGYLLQEFPIPWDTHCRNCPFPGQLLQEFPISRDTHCRNCPLPGILTAGRA